MAYDFGSDILVDAMRAADPVEAAQASQRIRDIASKRVGAAGGQAAFSLGDAAPKSRPQVAGEVDTLRKFEAAVLTTFIQSMMPKEASSVYGEGFAGDMWKSKMAETIADQLAQRGGIGIADRMIKDFQIEGDKVSALHGISDAAAAPALSRAQDQANSFLQKLEIATLGVSQDAEETGTVIPSTGRG